MVGFVDPARIPLWMTAGPSLNVYTTEDKSEEWFRNVFCAAIGHEETEDSMQCSIGVLAAVREAEGGDEASGGESSCGGGGNSVGRDWAVTEMLFYGRVEKKEVAIPDTPPNSSPVPAASRERIGGEENEEGVVGSKELLRQPKATQIPATKTITTITIHVLPLTSHHNFSNPATLLKPSSPHPDTTITNSETKLKVPAQPAAPLTPVNQSKLNYQLTQKASFLLPNPLDSPQISKSVKKRRADVLSQAAEHRKRRGIIPVVPPPPPQPSRRPSIPPLPQSREQSVLRSSIRENTAFSAREKERDRTRESDDIRRQSRSPSPTSTRASGGSRPGTSGMLIKNEPSFSNSFSWPKPAQSSRPASRASGGVPVKREPRSVASVTSPTSPTGDMQIVEATVEARNKDSLSRMIMSGMRLYGLRRGSCAGAGAANEESQPSTSNRGTGATASAEEYKYIYHNTLKSAIFVLVSIYYLFPCFFRVGTDRVPHHSVDK